MTFVMKTGGVIPNLLVGFPGVCPPDSVDVTPVVFFVWFLESKFTARQLVPPLRQIRVWTPFFSG